MSRVVKRIRTRDESLILKYGAGGAMDDFQGGFKNF
jgi:hypothetical protein